MESLTNEELAFVRRISGGKGKRAQSKRLSWVALCLLCCGAILIVAPDLVDLFRRNIALPTFLLKFGFVLVIVGFGVIQFQFARYAAIAESTISKLYQASHDQDSSPA